MAIFKLYFFLNFFNFLMFYATYSFGMEENKGKESEMKTDHFFSSKLGENYNLSNKIGEYLNLEDLTNFKKTCRAKNSEITIIDQVLTTQRKKILNRRNLIAAESIKAPGGYILKLKVLSDSGEKFDAVMIEDMIWIAELSKHHLKHKDAIKFCVDKNSSTMIGNLAPSLPTRKEILKFMNFMYNKNTREYLNISSQGSSWINFIKNVYFWTSEKLDVDIAAVKQSFYYVFQVDDYAESNRGENNTGGGYALCLLKEES